MVSRVIGWARARSNNAGLRNQCRNCESSLPFQSTPPNSRAMSSLFSPEVFYCEPSIGILPGSRLKVQQGVCERGYKDCQTDAAISTAASAGGLAGSTLYFHIKHETQHLKQNIKSLQESRTMTLYPGVALITGAASGNFVPTQLSTHHKANTTQASAKQQRYPSREKAARKSPSRTSTPTAWTRRPN